MRSRPPRVSTSVALALLLLASGWGYIGFGPRGVLAPKRDLPLADVVVRVDADGTPVAQLDHAQWCAAFREVGLAEPPDLDGTDVVPVRIALDAARLWAKTRDGDVLGQLGQVYSALEHHAAAADCFAAAAELGRERARWTYMLGAESQTLGWTPAAIDALERARGTDEGYAVTHARLGELYLATARLDDAEASFARAVRLRPSLSIAHSGRARVALERNDPALAAQHLELAVAAAPNDFAAHSLLSRAYAALGRDEAAKREAAIGDSLPVYRGWVSFDERLEQAQAAARTQRHLENVVRVALGRGDLAGAFTAGQELLARRPRDANLLSLLATVSSNLGQHPRAQALIAQAVELQPMSDSLRVSQAEIAIAAGDVPAAAEIARRLLGSDARSAPAHRIRGRVEFLSNRFDAALATYERAVELDPASAEARVELAEVLLHFGRDAEAKLQLEGVLARDPSHAGARQVLQRIDAGRSR